jgi:hypothetical protein
MRRPWPALGCCAREKNTAKSEDLTAMLKRKVNRDINAVSNDE